MLKDLYTYSDIEAINKRLKNAEIELNSKIDCDVFDNEIASLRALIGNLEVGSDKK